MGERLDGRPGGRTDASCGGGRSGGSGNGNGLKTGSGSVGMRSSELGSGAGDGTFL